MCILADDSFVAFSEGDLKYESLFDVDADFDNSE